jgi:uncharacterized membrane protein (Fun14 family)
MKKLYFTEHRFLSFLLSVLGVFVLSEVVGAERVLETVEAVPEVASSASETVKLAVEAFKIPDNYRFILTTLGAGGIAGWAVGFTLKKVAKIFALILGIVFVSLQVLAYKKLISIDWSKIESLVAGNQELENSVSGVMSVITYNLPFAGSFIIGFWLGFKKG